MTTLSNVIRLRCVRATLAALAVASSLVSVAPGEASAQGRARRPAAAEAAPREAAPRQAAPRGAAPASENGVVNIQTATPEQLQLLPGIGPSKAQAIVEQRDRRAFRRVEDILRVRGIGRATFRRLRPMLTVDGPTTLTTRPPRQARPAAEAEDDIVEPQD